MMPIPMDSMWKLDMLLSNLVFNSWRMGEEAIGKRHAKRVICRQSIPSIRRILLSFKVVNKVYQQNEDAVFSQSQFL